MVCFTGSLVTLIHVRLELEVSFEIMTKHYR